MHVALRLDRRESVDDLLVAGGPERHDREDLRLAALEQGRAMRPRKHADLDGELTDVLEASAVRADPLIEDRPTDLLLEERVEHHAHVRFADRIDGSCAPLGPPTGHQRRDALAL